MRKKNQKKMNDFIKEIENADTIAITGHISPDGDCVGSVIGLYNYITGSYNKTVQVYLENFSKDFMFLNGAEFVKHELDDKVYDLCIVVDCGDAERQGIFIKYYQEAGRTMCIDHHISNQGFGDICYVDVEACSAAEALYKLMDTNKIDSAAAEALYLGIVHDTGVFKHSNTTKSAMTIAGCLIEKGARPYYVIDETFYKKTFTQNKLLGLALSKACLYSDGKIINSVLTTDDFNSLGASKLDTDGIVDQLRITEGIDVAFFMYQTGNDEYKISLRSNNIVDVSQIACRHGGGGHIRAAGFSMTGNPDMIVDIVVEDINKQL
ncbi:MAG: bifunctional oligoribonuclease/PAP phosphatase NrnA [Coprococcus sp.]